VVANAPLQIVRTGSDGVTGLAVLRPETFTFLNEALWAPDGSFVITARAPAENIFQGSIVELYSADSTIPMIPLAPFGRQLKWGQ